MPPDAVRARERADRTNSLPSYPAVADRRNSRFLVPNRHAAGDRGSVGYLASDDHPPTRNEAGKLSRSRSIDALSVVLRVSAGGYLRRGRKRFSLHIFSEKSSTQS